jgi:integrase
VKRKTPHAAVPFAEIPQLLTQLASHAGVGVRALQFLILTAARAGEATAATWNEINLEDAVWTIPPARMKARREHRVPLAPEAIALLESLPREANNPHVFVGARQGTSITTDIMTHTLRRLGRSETIHGMRAAFSTWAHERTSASNHTIEMCLAHAVGSAVEQAYRRSDLFQKRRALMTAWAKFCMTPPKAQSDKVVPLRGTA